ncbi:ornithine monooxygenase [Xylanibacillus composti]|uniref:L-lysine N6-monooxygenase MbtG n=1 Tax=Xylanibacillus composti TaxID=1572762 RepID=A0A8J4M4Q8_9BACL|nr:SidA/IucD/PvdA family monooxygenase [Xylanibacillus composti]MDT9727181.1 ornithine monooxygenase [Xylanibacillus composti]GIQ71480.1 L-ornithine N(5)-monooxygenase [Xylanibacillus composti]
MQRKKTVGIGLGPSNLALAIALVEKVEPNDCMDWVFLEKNENICWHPDMLLEGSRLQISFLKDLVTLRNPTSPFTFLNYLKCKGRLNEFINLGRFCTERVEFTDYLTWIHSQLPDELSVLNSTVKEVTPVFEDDSSIRELDVVYLDNAREVEVRIRTNTVIVAIGGNPSIPNVFKSHIGDRVFHSSQFLSRLNSHKNRKSKQRIGVVGSGQSAVEIIKHLYETIPDCEIHSIFRKSAFKPADNSPFVNEVFFPEETDFMFNLQEDKKRMEVLKEYWQTNYSAVELDLLESVYNKIYIDRVKGIRQINIHNFSNIEALAEDRDGQYLLTLKHVLTETLSELKLDMIILATGYDRQTLPEFLEPVLPYMQFERSRISINRDYSVNMEECFKPRIYIQGMSQSTHGISDTLLSVLPIRAQEILESVMMHQHVNNDEKVVV